MPDFRMTDRRRVKTEFELGQTGFKTNAPAATDDEFLPESSSVVGRRSSAFSPEALEAAAREGNPVLRDPRVIEELKAFEQRRMEKSPVETIEAWLRKYEENYQNEATKAQRWKGQERWQGRENEEMRMVRIRHPYWVIRQLQRSGVNAEITNPSVDEFVWEKLRYHPHGDFEIVGDVGPRIWLNRYVRLGRVGVTCWTKPERGTRAYERSLYVAKTLTTLQYPYGPEWSVMRFDEYDRPTNEKYRGWRTALLGLIVAGVLTEAQVNAAFGKPSGWASEFYREQLFAARSYKTKWANPNGIANL